MTNFDTVKAITENLKTALGNLGIRFALKTREDKENTSSGQVPYGQIFYAGESFEYGHGEKPLYGEAEFVLKVILNGRDPEDTVREEQRWVHSIREALTAGSLNTGDLAESKYVSRVTTKSVKVENLKNTSTLVHTVSVRYREV